MARVALLSLAIFAVLLAGCSNTNSLPRFGATSNALAVQTKMVPGVCDTQPGAPAWPNPVIAYNDKLYGTTANGGAYGRGVLFSVTPAGTENTVRSFDVCPGPQSGALDAAGGTLYGINSFARNQKWGLLFGVRPADGKLQYLYDFPDTPRGAYPEGGVIDDGHGTLYGTTGAGGGSDDGTIYSVDRATGKVTVLYSFKGGNDGYVPQSLLTLVNGTLYGTTAFGGPIVNGSCGCGTVFAYDIKSGQERLLHTFAGTGGNDGRQPVAGVTYYNGKLYGATVIGGNGTDCPDTQDGCGTIYRVDPLTKDETVLYSFPGNSGHLPLANLTLYHGKLYGTTQNTYPLQGTIYSVDPSNGAVSQIYALEGNDGINPQALVALGGHLYGSAQFGGTNNNGTIFRFDPPGTFNVIYDF